MSFIGKLKLTKYFEIISITSVLSRKQVEYACGQKE